MSVESDVQSGAHAAAETAAPTPVGNPLLLGLTTFLPGGITLGLWFVGYLDTATLPGGMIPALSLCTGLFMLVATIWAGRLAMNTVAAVLGVFSAFWLSFSLLVVGLTSGWWGITQAAQVASVQRTYLLSFLIVFVIVTLATLRLPIVFTLGLLFVDATFALAFIGVSAGNTSLFPIAGITTFIFCAIFAYVLVDGMGQDLGGRSMPMGSPMVK
ncbi:acetate uptake transporter family protein [Pseudonocardia benzenivorans]|jgi:succinate-acetate transporter protein|uniref:GPR1/FUN34/yaaH family protein n=2 Tax=Pseudonocardia TaxID=1847 RepID=F4CUY1_PSEUX|nr:GPR1/FUN34/YaaH family transporter [Pseudonocardia dioxanivorans]AEA27450.1 hypothetical protein Psed_5316 [Pseudonocardia dioxanivorans CB1190]GJF06935.1 hypothetical protein PSD17_58820 [Pseudonocardia sp. D17]